MPDMIATSLVAAVAPRTGKFINGLFLKERICYKRYITFCIFGSANCHKWCWKLRIYVDDFSEGGLALKRVEYSPFILCPPKNDTWLLKIMCKSCRNFNNQVSFFVGHTV